MPTWIYKGAFPQFNLLLLEPPHTLSLDFWEKKLFLAPAGDSNPTGPT